MPQEETQEENIHASCVFFAEMSPPSAVLIRGVPGSGKSDLSLRLIDEGAQLVGDDQVWVKVRDGVLYARPPAATAGMLEVRGVGIVRFGAVEEAPVRLIVELVAQEEIQRLPDREHQRILGVVLPRIRLYPFEVSASVKLRLALEQEIFEK